MRITTSDVRRAQYLVTATGAAELLDDAMRTDRRGRPAACNAELFLTGTVLNIQRVGNTVIEDIHRTLTSHIPRNLHWELGIRWQTRSGNDRCLTLNHLYSFTKRLAAKLGYRANPDDCDLDPDERTRRITAVDEVVDALIRATLGHGTPTSSFAIDETAVWAWGKGRPSDRPEEPNEDEDDDGPDGDGPAGARPPSDNDDGDGGDGSNVVWDPDAAWGGKTPKHGNKPDWYYGYGLHAVARVYDLGGSAQDLPVLIEGIELTPANTDVVAPSLTILDRLLDAGREVTDLIGDRHYSFKDPERWADELADRDINQHLDLHKYDQGFKPYNRAKLAAGWLHCPGTPDRLGTITRPAPGASEKERREFRRLIDEREAYAFAPNGTTAAGNPRGICPARAGKVGCPLVDGTVAAANQFGLPVIANPPDPEHAPACCTQKTVTLGSDGDRKLRQPHYWGSKTWKRSYDRRSHVEGLFGNLKNDSTEAVGRGFHRLTGISRIKLLLGVAVAVCNMRQLRNWHERTGNGDPDHPLLAPDPDDHGIVELAARQAAELDASYTSADVGDEAEAA